jgi:quercetin dioxygenase-like cupin family protein
MKRTITKKTTTGADVETSTAAEFDALNTALLLAAKPTNATKNFSARAARMKENLLAKIAHREEIVVKRALHAGATSWRSIAPNIEMQVLMDNGTQCTRLVRFSPGGISIGHTHQFDEGALIVEGACSIGPHQLTTGDYHFVPAGQSHGDIVSPGGCILLVNGPSLKSRRHNDVRPAQRV